MKLYFIGIGGIGMSALVRYFLSKGDSVAGYDLTPSPLTHALSEEGATIHYEDDPELIPEPFRTKDTLVVLPWVPATQSPRSRRVSSPRSSARFITRLPCARKKASSWWSWGTAGVKTTRVSFVRKGSGISSGSSS